MSNGQTKSLLKILSKIKTSTAAIIRDARYDTTSAGLTRNSYQQERGWRKHVRAVAKLNRLCTEARMLAEFFDRPILSRVFIAVDLTAEILSCCRDFPREEEWPGTEPFKFQQGYLTGAQRLLRETL